MALFVTKTGNLGGWRRFWTWISWGKFQGRKYEVLVRSDFTAFRPMIHVPIFLLSVRGASDLMIQHPRKLYRMREPYNVKMSDS